jgi:hypothetical protein
MKKERRGGSVREKKWKEKEKESMRKERRGVSVREKWKRRRKVLGDHMH